MFELEKYGGRRTMAKQAKVVSILVLSGEATLEDLNDSHEIDIIVSSVDKLLR